MFEHPFASAREYTVGVEEELMLLDPELKAAFPWALPRQLVFGLHSGEPQPARARRRARTARRRRVARQRLPAMRDNVGA